MPMDKTSAHNKIAVANNTNKLTDKNTINYFLKQTSDKKVNKKRRKFRIFLP